MPSKRRRPVPGPVAVRGALAAVLQQRFVEYSYFLRQGPYRQRRGVSAVSSGRMDLMALVAQYDLRVLYDDAEAVAGMLDVRGVQVGDALFQEVPDSPLAPGGTWVRIDHGTLGRSEFAPLLWLYGALDVPVVAGEEQMVDVTVDDLAACVPARFAGSVLEGLALFGIDVSPGTFPVAVRIADGMVRSISYTLIDVNPDGTDDRFALELRPADPFDVALPAEVASYPDVADFRKHAAEWRLLPPDRLPPTDPDSTG